MPHIKTQTIVVENFKRLVSCAPDDDGEPGPLLGKRMREIGCYEGDLAIGIRKGRVHFFGYRVDLPPEYQGATRFDCQGRLVTPALVDCHTHPAFVASRVEEFLQRVQGATYEEIAGKGGGILQTTRMLRQSPNDALFNATLRNLTLLRNHGVAVAECKSGYGLSLEHELRQLRCIVSAAAQLEMHSVGTCLAAHSLPEEYRGSAARREAYLHLVCEQILPEAARSGMAKRADVFCERGAFTVEETRRVGNAAKAVGLEMTIHADQMSASGGAMIAAELKARSADHLEYTDLMGMKALKDAGTAAVLLPGSTYYLGQDKWADARTMINGGLCVALATDFNPGSSPICNPAFIMHLAVTKLRMSPEEAFSAFTVNAAHALGLTPGEWGCIREGARAAFAIWDLRHEREIAYYVGGNMCAGVVTCEGWRE
ncbi:MAG: imidazolonepropionase [Planctomycetes bacterium]|nr:imidazolonepropionase [Planctomycetota bacterium]